MENQSQRPGKADAAADTDKQPFLQIGGVERGKRILIQVNIFAEKMIFFAADKSFHQGHNFHAPRQRRIYRHKLSVVKMQRIGCKRQFRTVAVTMSAATVSGIFAVVFFAAAAFPATMMFRFPAATAVVMTAGAAAAVPVFAGQLGQKL